MQFRPLNQWRAVHAGLYWAEVLDKFPTTENKPPLPRIVGSQEQDPLTQEQMSITFGSPDADLARFWFVSADQTSLIQLQRDRFALNWRKIRDDQAYPRYDKELRPQFIEEWTRFISFVSNRNIGNIEVDATELVYINDIPRGIGWNTGTDAIRLFSPWWGEGTDGWLPPPETVSVQGTFRLPEDRGRLYFATQHLRRNIDNHEIVQLRLFARGKPSGNQTSDIMNWMDIGREWIVRAFSDITSKSAHELWGRAK